MTINKFILTQFGSGRDDDDDALQLEGSKEIMSLCNLLFLYLI